MLSRRWLARSEDVIDNRATTAVIDHLPSRTRARRLAVRPRPRRPPRSRPAGITVHRHLPLLCRSTPASTTTRPSPTAQSTPLFRDHRIRSSRFQSQNHRNSRRSPACAPPQPLTSPTETTQAPLIVPHPRRLIFDRGRSPAPDAAEIFTRQRLPKAARRNPADDGSRRPICLSGAPTVQPVRARSRTIRRLLVRASSRSIAAVRSVGSGSVVQRLPARLIWPRRSSSCSRASTFSLLSPAARAAIDVEKVPGSLASANSSRSGRLAARGSPARGLASTGFSAAAASSGTRLGPDAGLGPGEGLDPGERSGPDAGFDAGARSGPGAGLDRGARLGSGAGSSAKRARQLAHTTTGSPSAGRTTSSRRHRRPEWQTLQRRPPRSISVRSSVFTIFLP